MALPVGNARFYGRLWTASLRFALRQPDTPRRNGLSCLYLQLARASTIIIFIARQTRWFRSTTLPMPIPCVAMCSIRRQASVPTWAMPISSRISCRRQPPGIAVRSSGRFLQLPKEENVSLYVGLATIYLKLNDFDASPSAISRRKPSFRRCRWAMQAYYLNNYGNYYYYKKDYAQSLRKFRQLKLLLEKHKKDDCSTCISAS